MAMHEQKPDAFQLEMQQVFGKDVVIKESDKGPEIRVVLESGELKGGQVVEAIIGNTEPLPLDLSEYGYTLSGRRIQELRVDGNAIPGYNIFINPTTQDGLSIVGLNFADSDARLVVLSSLSRGEDLATLFHEIGHVESGHNLTNRRERQTAVDASLKPYIGANGTIDSVALRNDTGAIFAINGILEQEYAANNAGLSLLRQHEVAVPPDTESYLEAKVKDEYLHVYGL